MTARPVGKHRLPGLACDHIGLGSSAMVAPTVPPSDDDSVAAGTSLADPKDPNATQTSDSLQATEPADGAQRPRSAVSILDRDRARYEIIGEHGRGGIGRVSRARDRELGRDVAIKELISRGVVSEVRFIREATITARLEHPGIVPVHDAGRWPDGTPFYAMKLVSGRPLRDLIAERTTAEQRIDLLHHVIAVADAIAYAHGRNIIHRDLKPANVIVGDFGETIVIDWGLAKDLTSDDDDVSQVGPFRRPALDDGLTAIGDILGTPLYMAPEQQRGEPVDQRADVYAIGAMLWELCTLQKLTADDAGQRRRVLRRAGIDLDLIAIIEKATDPVALRRYPEAGALAADLKRFKSGARIAARSYSLFGTLAHWMRRHRAQAVSIVAAVIAVIAGTTFYVRSVAAERDRTDAALQSAEASNKNLARERAAAISQRNALILTQATAALDSDPTRALEWLKTYPIDGADWARVQVIAADAFSRGIAQHILPTESQTISISPDGKTVLTAGPNDQVQVWDLATGRLVRTMKLAGEAAAAAFAPDSSAIAVGDRGGDVVLWQPSSDTRTVLGKLDSGALYIAFSPDGRRVIAGSLHAITAWDAATGRQAWSMSSQQAITMLGVAPVGDTLAYSTADGALHLSELTPAHRRELRGHHGRIAAIAFSPDGRWIVTSGVDHQVRLWDSVTGGGRLLGEHDGAVREVRFSPTDPTLIASGGADQKLRLWSTTGKRTRVLSGHTDMVNGVMFSPDGQLIATAGADRQVRLWDVATGEVRVLRGHLGALGDVRFTPDGSVLVSSGYDLGTRVWRIEPPPSRVIGRHDVEAIRAAFSPDGEFVASSGTERTARLWNLKTGREQILHGADYSCRAPANRPVFSASGDLLASGGDSAVHLWNVRTGEARTFDSPETLVRKVALTADGRWLATAGSDGRVRLWDVASNRVTLLEGHRGEVLTVEFLADGRHLASAATDGVIRVWDLSASPITSRELHSDGSTVTSLAASPTGELVASGSDNGIIHLWNITTGAHHPLSGHTGSVIGLAFSRDGRWLVSSSSDATARVWNVATSEVRVLRGHDELVRAVAITSDGGLVATASNDRTVRLWDLRTGAIAILRGHTAEPTSVAFDAEDRRLVTASEDATVRLWDLSRVLWVPRDPGEIANWLGAQTTADLPQPAAAGNSGSTP